MKYAKMRKYDTSNWSGVNSTIFFSGCTHKCPGCFNEEAQDFNHGWEFDKTSQDLFIDYANDIYVTGVCILGGEPFQQNFDEMWAFLFRLVKEVGKPIHVWTGYKYEYLYNDGDLNQLLLLIDTLVDGPYELDKRDLTLKYRGSSNQRVIDVMKTLACGKIHQMEVE